MSDFDWREDPDIVVGAQQALAIYLNSDGAIVLRQEGMPYDEEDDIIVIQAVNAKAVVDAIVARAAESREAVRSDVPEPVRIVHPADKDAEFTVFSWLLDPQALKEHKAAQ